MPNTFNIVITATDKATATIRSVNDQFAKLTRPFDQVGKSFKRFGQELGLDNVGKQIGKMGTAARSTAEKIGGILTPMAALTSVASIGGVVAMADSWAKFGRSVTYGAQAIGVSAPQFQRLQQLGQVAGVGADAVTSSMENLGTVMQDAKWGRNQQALMLFNRLGIGLKQTKEGAPDVIGQMHAIAKVIASPQFKNNPFEQALIANTAGLGAMLPILRQGETGIAHYEAMMKRLGYVSSDQQIASANKFAESMAGLKIATDGLGQSISDEVMPAIQPFIDELSTWIAANRQLIAQRVAEWAKGFAEWLKSINWKAIGAGITKFIQDVGRLVDMVGGWKTAALAVVVVMNGALIASVISLTTSIAGPLLRGLAAVVSTFWGWATAADAAATASTAATAAGEEAAAVGAGTVAKGLLGKAGLVGAAAAAGYGIGTIISKKFVEGTSFGDKLGSGIARGMAALGSTTAQEAVAREDRADLIDRAKKRAVANPHATKQAMDYFKAQGWTPAQAAGLSANLLEESGLNQTATGDNGAAYGIGQWHKDRQAAFAKLYGHPIQGSTLQEQLGFVQYELTQGNEQRAGGMLKASQGAGMAGEAVSRFYERPAATEEAAASRGALAQQLAGTYGASPAGPVAGAAGAAPTGPMVGAAGATGKTVIELQMPNAPPGTKATVKQQADNATVQPMIGLSAIGASP